MKIIKLILILLFISSSWSCEKDDRQTDKEDDRQTEINLLKGTEWKLGGIVDVAANTVTILEPEDCKECYTLAFDTDSTASGKAVTASAGIKNLYDLSDKFDDTDIEELISDAELYREIIRSITSFTYINGELKFFYNDNKNYLLYEPPLKGTEWRLVGFVDAATGNLTEAEPKPDVCAMCYSIRFYTNTKGRGVSILNEIWINLSDKKIFGLMTEVGDYHHGNVILFYEATITADSYKLEKDELKIFYNDKKNYLLYKFIKQ